MRRTPLCLREPPPAKGEHGPQLLREAGFTPTHIAHLQEKGVFG